MELSAAYELATGLLEEHSLTGWRVEFDTAKRLGGVCRYADRVIGLSAPLTRLHDEAEVRDTVLHEVAHALVGAAHGHDEVWRRAARAIGCSGQRCVAADVPRLTGAWVGVSAAGHVRDRHRRPERVMACGECNATFSADHVFEWTFHGRPAAMHPNYVHELEALMSGRRLRLLGVGSEVRVTAPGEFHGLRGRVMKVGRTSYHVRVRQGMLRVVFAGVEPASG